MQARLKRRGLKRCRCFAEPQCALQLLPCGHMMCEECHAKSYPRGMKGGPRCAFCRKPFAASSAFRCPLQPSRQLRRDDPKYAMVHFCLPQSTVLRQLYWVQAPGGPGRPPAQEEGLVQMANCFRHPGK